MTARGVLRPASLVDGTGRELTYLRVALTERCNLRCRYCMPNGLPANMRSEELSPSELGLVGEVAGSLGVRRIRLTGGEPLMRADLPAVIESFARAPGIEEVSLTTNGLRLAERAADLARAGLSRVNVSLDTLRPDRYQQLTGLGGVERVLGGLAAAEAAGLSPIKVNVVAMRGVNDDELEELARMTVDRPWHVRFIELMPVGTEPSGHRFFEERFLPVAEMRDRLGPLEDLPTESGGPARLYRLPGARGKVGLISPVSEHFCDTCNRLRLTATGELRPCLFSEEGVSLRPALERGDRAALMALFREAAMRKPPGHSIGLSGAGGAVAATAMAGIGG